MIKNQYKFIITAFFFILSIGNTVFAQKQTSDFVIGRVKYSGGGDWYNDQSADYNLLKYIAQNTNIYTNPGYQYVDLASDKIFEYPFYLSRDTGIWNFLMWKCAIYVHICKWRISLYRWWLRFGPICTERNEKSISRPRFRELPFSYGLYSIHYKFPQGPPKTHEHDNKPPKGFGYFIMAGYAFIIH